MELRLEKVKERLILNGLINRDDHISFIPTPGSFLRRDFKKVSKFRVDINGTSSFILRIAPDLKWLAEKYDILSENRHLFPEVILFFQEQGDDFLLEEFIVGETIESIIRKHPEKKIEIVKKVLTLHEELNKNVVNSNFESACEELDKLIDVLVGINFVTDVDMVIINSAIRPEIIKLLTKRHSFKRRLTQGDYIDRNIVMKKDGSLKIIDLEFSHETHFYGEEIIRFFNYSSSPVNGLLLKEEIDPIDEIYFNLNQMRLIITNQKEFIAPPSFDHLINEVMRILRTESDSFAYSRIVKLLVGDLILKYNVLLNDYTMIQNSATWKIGRLISFPFRKILSIFK